MTAIAILRNLIDALTSDRHDDAPVHLAALAASRVASHAAAAEPDDINAQGWDFAGLTLEHAAATLQQLGDTDVAVQLDDPIAVGDLPQIADLLRTLIASLLAWCDTPAEPADPAGRHRDARFAAVADLRQALGEVP